MLTTESAILTEYKLDHRSMMFSHDYSSQIDDPISIAEYSEPHDVQLNHVMCSRLASKDTKCPDHVSCVTNVAKLTALLAVNLLVATKFFQKNRFQNLKQMN